MEDLSWRITRDNLEAYERWYIRNVRFAGVDSAGWIQEQVLMLGIPIIRSDRCIRL
jgi:hypothetical protein